MPDNELFDDLTRILAATTSPRQKLRLIQSRVTKTGTFDLKHTGPRASDIRWPLRTIEKKKKLDVARTVANLRSAYLTRNTFVYRTEIFLAFLFLRYADWRELLRILDYLISDIKLNGADGIETLVLAAADGISTRGNQETKEQAQASIASLIKGNDIKFWSATTPPNFKIPLGRVSSYLVLDLRADAVRTLFIELVHQNDKRQEVQSIIDLLDSRETKEALCNMPPQQNQRGDPSESDKQRLENCKSNGSAGKPKAGSVLGSLGDLTSSGCNLMTRDEIEELQARIKKYDECLSEKSGSELAPSPNLFNGAIGPVSGILGIALMVKEIYEWVKDKVVGPREKYNEALEKAGAAQKEWLEAEKDVKDAKDALEKHKEELADWQDKRNAADIEFRDAVTPEEVEAAQERQRQAQAGIDDTNKKIDQDKVDIAKAEKEAKEKEDNAKAEATKANELKPHEEDDLQPDKSFMTEDCMKAFIGITELEERILLEKLGRDWKNWKGQKVRPPRGGWDPAPDDLQPYDALEPEICGTEVATVDNPSEGCNVPVDCLEGNPDESCGCGGTSNAEARLISKMNAFACANMHCGDEAHPESQAIARGVVCVCVESVEEDLKPPRPKPTVVAALFGNGIAEMPGEGNPNMGIIQRIFQNL